MSSYLSIGLPSNVPYKTGTSHIFHEKGVQPGEIHIKLENPGRQMYGFSLFWLPSQDGNNVATGACSTMSVRPYEILTKCHYSQALIFSNVLEEMNVYIFFTYQKKWVQLGEIHIKQELSNPGPCSASYSLNRHFYRYTAKLLFHQSPTRHSDYTVTTTVTI